MKDYSLLSPCFVVLCLHVKCHCLYSWHCAAHFTLLLVIASLMYCCARRQGDTFKTRPNTQSLPELGLADSKEAGYGMLSVEDSEDN